VQRKKTFLVVCFSILGSSLWAQIAPVGVLKNSGLTVGLPSTKNISLLKPEGAGKVVSVAAAPVIMSQMINGGPLYGSGYYIGNLGFFCKKELEIEKTTHLPLRLRLGSLQEVNRLEGKPGW
jgi:hypothetical protein